MDEAHERIRSAYFEFLSASSGKKSIAAGVPQGSILGPRLFLYYLHDIPKNDKTKLALFADDTAIYVASWKKTIAIKNVQGHLDELSKYYEKWKMQPKQIW